MTTPNPAALAPPARIGTFGNLTVDVRVQDAVGAAVDVSVACLFEREAGGAALQGGLLHLDRALDARVTRGRADGVFRGRFQDHLLMTPSVGQMAGTRLLLVGLGDPDDFAVERLTVVCALAVREAQRLGTKTAAFAPGLLDSGLGAPATDGAPRAMLRAVFEGSQGSGRDARTLERWSFDTGATHFAGSVAAFQAAYRELVTEGTSPI